MQVFAKPIRTTPNQVSRRKEPLDSLLDPALFKALSDPTRLKLLACLAKCRRPCTVSELAACCDVDLSVVSRHLAQLEDAGVLSSHKLGRVVSYDARAGDVARLLRALADAFESCSPEKSCCGESSCCEAAPPTPRTARRRSK